MTDFLIYIVRGNRAGWRWKGMLFHRFVQVSQTKMDKIGNIDSKICRKRACHCGAKCAIVKIKFSKKEVKFVCGSL